MLAVYHEALGRISLKILVSLLAKPKQKGYTSCTQGAVAERLRKRLQIVYTSVQIRSAPPCLSKIP